MAKNAVTDWSTNDSLNTDVGGTNVAEGCAPGGINDAIRKMMAQVAAFVASATFIGTISLKPAAADGTLLLYTDSTLKGAIRSSGGGTWYDSEAHTFKNLSEGVTYLSLGAVNANMTTPMTFNAGVSAGGMIRATGSASANTAQGAATEIYYNGVFGVVQAYDRGAAIAKDLYIYGANVTLVPTTGGLYSQGNHQVQGILNLGGPALGGVSGQVQFNRSDGATNLGNISWQAGNEFRIANNNGGFISHVVNGAEAFRSLTGGARLQHAQMPVLEFNRAGIGSWYVGGGGTAGDNGFAIRLNAAAPALYFDTANAASFNSSVTANGAIISTQQVKAGGSGAGSIRINAGDATKSGYLEFVDTFGTSIGYIQRTIGGTLNYNSVGGHAFNSFVQASGQVIGTTPGFGTSGGVAVRAAANGLSILQFTNNAGTSELASIIVDPNNGKIYLSINSAPVMSIDTSGNLRIAGSLIQGVAP